MIINLFNKFSLKNKIFQIDNQEIKLIRKEVNVENETNNEKAIQSLILSYENNKIKNIVIKSFNFEPNINGFEGLLKKKEKEIKKGIEHLKSLAEVKVISKKGDKFVNEILNGVCEIIEVSSREVVKEDKFIKKAFLNSDVELYDLYDISLLGQALLERKLNKVITVYGSSITTTGLISFNEDLTYNELFDLLGGKTEELIKVINGGVFTGKPVYDLNLKIDINTKSILFLTEKDCNYEKETYCISCGKCMRICPENLNPIKIVENIKLKEKNELEKLGIKNCIECGLCSYICPSNIEILQKIRVEKTTLNRGK